jgi:hypothetical protein
VTITKYKSEMILTIRISERLMANLQAIDQEGTSNTKLPKRKKKKVVRKSAAKKKSSKKKSC